MAHGPGVYLRFLQCQVDKSFTPGTSFYFTNLGLKDESDLVKAEPVIELGTLRLMLSTAPPTLPCEESQTNNLRSRQNRGSMTSGDIYRAAKQRDKISN